MRFTTKGAAFIVGALLLLTGSATAYFYKDLPQALVTHWDASGRPDGAAGKSWALLSLMPAAGALVALLLFALPAFDPIDKGYKDFRKEYDAMIILLVAFFCLMQGVTLALNLGLRLDLGRFLAPAVGLLFFGLGTLMPGFKRNWFAGIRTPWTLSSDAVWKKTHEHGGVVFRLIGILACFGAVLPRYSFYVMSVPIILGAAWVTLYSYLVFRKGAA